MYDAEANAKAVERVRVKNRERMRRAYTHIFASPEGRAFIHDLAETCRFYGSTKNLLEEGQRQIAIGIRDKAIELGFFGEWQRAEREAEEYQNEIRRMLEQTEVGENENY